MSTLFVDRRDIELEHDDGALVIRDRGTRIGTVPLAPITRVFLRGSVTLRTSVLGHLGERGIGVVILSGRKGQATLFFGRPHNDARLRVEQCRRSLDVSFCLAYARRLVHRKLEGQHQWLGALRDPYPRARYALTQAMRQLQDQQSRLPRAVDLDSLRGQEGAAACAYFDGLRAVLPASLGFNERNRRPPRDPFNALLSLTYTLTHAETALALHAAGLDPCVGFYHQISHARESLACDVMEAVRPLADRFCLELVARQTLTSEHFGNSEAGCLLGKAGRTRYYSAYEDHAPALRRAIQEEVKYLARHVAPELPEPSAYIAPWIPSPHSQTPEEGVDNTDSRGADSST
ncbi:MAG: CRISPR-associated protein Cas1 [Burkholderiaceae bacterium]|jgi:CRISPR-associated protein Cas1|nr:MAG: CRISPR-associated protein Cas1 [Burkholderiaceae bacterium]